MEKILYLNWKLEEENIKEELKYCHNCGKKVNFMDSGIRRQNANGKNIYHFAIYKCPKGHTWNKKLNIFKAYDRLENTPQQMYQGTNPIKDIVISQIISEAYSQIHIQVYASEKIRLDKLLATYIKDLSRTQIKRYMEEGYLYINDSVVKKNVFLSGYHEIVFMLAKAN